MTMGKLDAFTNTIPGDIYWNNLEIDADDSIVIGGSCTHTFELPFVYGDVVESAKVIYAQGVERLEDGSIEPIVKLAIPVTPGMVQTINGRSIIYVYLPATYTSVFDYDTLDVECQVSLKLKDGSERPCARHRLNVLKPLKSEAKKIVVGDVLVNGESVLDANGNAIVDLSKVVTDLSEDTLFALSAVELDDLIDEHYVVIPGERLGVGQDVYDHTDVAISCDFGGIVETLRLIRNGVRNMVGVTALKLGDSVYEVVVSLREENGVSFAVLRCATVC